MIPLQQPVPKNWGITGNKPLTTSQHPEGTLLWHFKNTLTTGCMIIQNRDQEFFKFLRVCCSSCLILFWNALKVTEVTSVERDHAHQEGYRIKWISLKEWNCHYTFPYMSLLHHYYPFSSAVAPPCMGLSPSPSLPPNKSWCHHCNCYHQLTG